MKNEEIITPVVHDNCILIQPVVHTDLEINVLPINPNGYINGIRNCLYTNLKHGLGNLTYLKHGLGNFTS